VLNKWDLMDDEHRMLMERSLEQRFGFVGWAPLIRISALTGARTKRLAGAIEVALESRERRLATGMLNRLIREWTGAHPPPVRKGRRPRIQYAVQAGTAPPTFIVFISGGELGDDYLRFLEGRIRDAVDLTGSPVRIITRSKPKRDR
jgi:GTP-binding protein